MSLDKLGIFNELKELDTRNTDFYNELEPEYQKKIILYPIMRWASGASRRTSSQVQEFCITTMNEVNSIFFSLSKHPELQWKLLASFGLGQVIRREWIPPMKKINTNKLDQLLLDYMPYLNKQELDMVKEKLTQDDVKDICKKFAMSDSEIKDYVNEFKKIK